MKINNKTVKYSAVMMTLTWLCISIRKIPMSFFVSILLYIYVVNSVAYAAGLTHSKALVLIQKAGVEQFKVEVPIGSAVNLDILLPTLESSNKNWGRQISVAYRCLGELGYLIIKRNRSHPLKAYSITATDKGK